MAGLAAFETEFWAWYYTYFNYFASAYGVPFMNGGGQTGEGAAANWNMYTDAYLAELAYIP